MLKGGQIVNGLGKYLKNHLTGSGNIKNGSNTCTVTIPLMYTEKPYQDTLDDGISKDTTDKTGTITFQVCIKTYDNKIAVSIFKGDLTLDLKSYPVGSFENYETKCIEILNYTKKRISKKFPQYDFQFC